MSLAPKTQAELQSQRAKLVNSYNELLEEFSAKELRSVGNYNVGVLIGKGSYGKVYLASHRLIRGSKVVLKQANKDEANLPREIHHHRQFLHPHIARLYEVVITESSVWLVLEYCPGDELYHYLTKHGPIEPTTVQKIFTQLVGAVSYVHSKSCVHRDLKLENILLDKHDNVKLCDFGFTREYEGKSSNLQTWCGTVCYSAPEMLKGEKYAGEKVDVWSLGIILYALLCGELPFDEDDDTATKKKILQEEPRYPETMPDGAKDLIMALLSKRPILRPSLADILSNPWLVDFASEQQAILKLQQPPPFSTQLETDLLERMRATGASVENIQDVVRSQRCNALAGWWALLLEKEQRKDRRRQQRRKERDDGRASRRVSAASNMVLGMVIPEAEEEKPYQLSTGDLARARGRSSDRVDKTGLPQALNGLPNPPYARTDSDGSPRAQPQRSSLRVANHRRSQYNFIDSKRHSSTLQLVVNNPSLLVADPKSQPGKKGNPGPWLNHFASIKQWFKSSKKNRKRTSTHVNFLQPPVNGSGNAFENLPHANPTISSLRPYTATSGSLPPSPRSGTYPLRPRLVTRTSTSSHRRISSHSPSPITPQSSYHRSNGPSNLRSRASTSSSISSVPSILGHRPSPSRGSLASSSEVGSPPLSTSTLAQRRRHSKQGIKVLHTPAHNPISLSNGTPHLRPSHSALTEANAAFSNHAPLSPGLVFAKRKRTPFRGPVLNTGAPSTRRRSDPNAIPSRQGSAQGLPSGEAPIQEEDEEDIEEVDYFSPITGPGELVTDQQFTHK